MSKSRSKAIHDPCAKTVKVRGTVVPPYKAMAERWAAFSDENWKNGSPEPGLKAFLDSLPKGDGIPEDVGDPPVPSARSRTRGKTAALPDDTEGDTRVFRAAMKVASLFRIDGGDADLPGAKPSTQIEVHFRQKSLGKFKPLAGKLLDEAIEKALLHKVKQPVDDMCSQDAAPELFMLAAAAKGPIDQGSIPYTCFLMDVLVLGTAFVNYEAKGLTRVKRPLVSGQTSLKLPGHSSWPSGHAFTCAALAVLLATITNADKVELKHAARRIGYNRVRGGLHTFRDVNDGLKLGASLAKALLNAAMSAGKGSSDPIEKRLAVFWTWIQAAQAEWP